MQSRVRIGIVTCALVLCLPLPIRGAGITRLDGVASDSRGASVPNAHIELFDVLIATRPILETTTDARGRFELLVEDGTYRIRATKDGYCPSPLVALTYVTGAQGLHLVLNTARSSCP